MLHDILEKEVFADDFPQLMDKIEITAIKEEENEDDK